jgi:hypothetical protein
VTGQICTKVICGDVGTVALLSKALLSIIRAEHIVTAAARISTAKTITEPNLFIFKVKKQLSLFPDRV